MATAESKFINEVTFLSELRMGHAQKTCFLDIEKALQESRCCLGLLSGKCSAEGIGVFLLQVLLVTSSIKTMGGRKDVANNGREQFWHT